MSPRSYLRLGTERRLAFWTPGTDSEESPLCTQHAQNYRGFDSLSGARIQSGDFADSVTRTPRRSRVLSWPTRFLTLCSSVSTRRDSLPFRDAPRILRPGWTGEKGERWKRKSSRRGRRLLGQTDLLVSACFSSGSVPACTDRPVRHPGTEPEPWSAWSA